MGSGIITVMKSKVWVLGSLGNKPLQCTHSLRERKKPTSCSFKNMHLNLGNGWTSVFQILNERVSQ